MAEYIERESLLKEMLGLHTIPVYIGHVTDEDVMFETMVDVVKEQPIADVVEVVRCKDCKHCERINDEFAKDWYQCVRRGNFARKKPNDYCSYGERKDSND